MLVLELLWIDLTLVCNRRTSILVNQRDCLWLRCIWSLSCRLDAVLRHLCLLLCIGLGRRLYLFAPLAFSLGSSLRRRRLGRHPLRRHRMRRLVCILRWNFICFLHHDHLKLQCGRLLVQAYCYRFFLHQQKWTFLYSRRWKLIR